jgi:hypothetical protein
VGSIPAILDITLIDSLYLPRKKVNLRILSRKLNTFNAGRRGQKLKNFSINNTATQKKVVNRTLFFKNLPYSKFAPHSAASSKDKFLAKMISVSDLELKTKNIYIVFLLKLNF